MLFQSHFHVIGYGSTLFNNLMERYNIYFRNTHLPRNRLCVALYFGMNED